MRRTAIWIVAATAALVAAPAAAQSHRMLARDQSAVHCVAFSADGTAIVSGHADGGVRLWDLQRPGEPVLLGSHLRVIYAVACSPDGKTAASGSHDLTVKLWDLAERKEQATLGGFRGRIYSVAFSPDGKTLASGGGVFATAGELRLWDVAGGQQTAACEGLTHWVRAVAFAPDGDRLASGGGRLLLPGQLRLWNPADVEEPTTAGGPRDEVLGVAFAPDGKTLAAAGRDMTVRLFDVEGKAGAVLRGHTAEVIYVGYAGAATIVSAGLDNTVRFWDSESGRQTGEIYDPRWPMPQRRDGGVFSLALSADCKQLALGTLDGQIKLWNVADVIHHRTPLYPVVWSAKRTDRVRLRPRP